MAKRGAKPKYTELTDKEWLRYRYIDLKMTSEEIADEIDFNCSSDQVLYWLHKHGIKKRDASEVRRVRQHRLKNEESAWKVH